MIPVFVAYFRHEFGAGAKFCFQHLNIAVVGVRRWINKEGKRKEN
jgi:predicted phosphohydrolase